MSKPSLILVGAGGHAGACLDVIEQLDAFHIAGLIGTEAELHNEYMGYLIIGVDRDLTALAEQYSHAIITVGQIESAEIRQRLFEQAVVAGFQMPVIVSPRAYVSKHAIVGAGTLIMHGAIVNAGAKIGKNCIINSRSLIEHDASVADNCHISTGAIVNGAATVGAGSFVGSGSVIKQGVILGRNCLVGMGIAVRYHYADNAKILTGSK